LLGGAAVAVGLGLYYINETNIPDWLGWMSFALAAGDVLAIILALLGHRYAAGVMAQVMPIVPVLIAASAFSVDAGFGSYLFIGALGVMVTIPEGHNRARIVCVVLLVIGIVVIQAYFTRAHSWAPLPTDQTAALNTFNRTVMTVALFALALELTRVNRASRRLVDQSLRIADLIATTDPLTGLPNRRPAWERLETGALDGRTTTIGIADMDHFKALNDEWGHNCGDDALRHVAALFVDAVRANDLVARWGGEEFMVLVDLPPHEAVTIFERLRRRVTESPVPCTQGPPHHVSVSIGIAPLKDADPVAAIAAADSALYRAKQGGRDRVVA